MRAGLELAVRRREGRIDRGAGRIAENLLELRDAEGPDDVAFVSEAGEGGASLRLRCGRGAV